MKFWMSDLCIRIRKAARCAVFLMLAAAILIICNNIIRQVPKRYSKERFPGFYAEPENSIHVVSIGSSACTCYIDVFTLYEKFGITSYNLGGPLAPTAATLAIMEEAEKTQDPDLYIIEAREFLHLKEKNRVKSMYTIHDSMNLSLNKWKLICHSYADWYTRITAFLDIFKYHGNWDRVTKKDFGFWSNKKLSDHKNWGPFMTTVPFETPVHEDEESEPLFEHNVKELELVLADSQKKGRKLLFVVTPYLYGAHFNGRMKTLKKMIEDAGFDFLDLTEGAAYGLDYATDFHDKNHVNYKGAEKMTTALGEYVDAHYEIGRDIPDKARIEWDSCLAAYSAMIAEARAEEAAGTLEVDEGDDPFENA